MTSRNSFDRRIFLFEKFFNLGKCCIIKAFSYRFQEFFALAHVARIAFSALNYYDLKMKRIEPKAGQESVWDYPRPPKLEQTHKHLKIVYNGEIIAETNRAFRVLETSHPPVYYFPPEDVRMEFLTEAGGESFCEWKGAANYYDLTVGRKSVKSAAWFYPNPTPNFAEIKDYLAFYPSKMDACFVNDELVKSQQGDFYGGWITSEIVGPFKGGAGTWGW